MDVDGSLALAIVGEPTVIAVTSSRITKLHGTIVELTEQHMSQRDDGPAKSRPVNNLLTEQNVAAQRKVAANHDKHHLANRALQWIPLQLLQAGSEGTPGLLQFTIY